MDARMFDHWTVAVAKRPTRRAALRLLAGGLLGGLLPRRRAAPAGAETAEDCAAQGLSFCEDYYLGGICVDLASDPVNCGACGLECVYGELCSDGACGSSCAAGLSYCNGACVDTASDPAHCGICNIPCPPVEVDGVTYVQACCGGVCVDTGVDLNNCGGCGIVCGGTDGCVGGTCVEGPGSCANQGLTDCGGACVDLASDAGHCGACFNSCPLGGVCQGGVCGGVICFEPQVDCGGYCADLQTDYANCGACHTFCDSGVCTGGACAPVCSGPGSLCLSGDECCSGDCIGICV